jgi:hypothetical protein
MSKENEKIIAEIERIIRELPREQLLLVLTFVAQMI